MAALVADCSVFLPLCFQDEESEAAEEMLGRIQTGGALVPAIWWYEIRNVLVVNERRGRIAPEDSNEFLHLLSRLPIAVVLVEDPDDTVSLAREQGLTVYDAAYLALARQQDLPLFTLDKRLAGAARKCGVPVGY